MPVILGHDPSLAAYGLALVDTDGPRLLAHAVIVTAPPASRSERLRTLYSALRLRIDAWQDTHAIDSAAFEAGFAFAGGGRGADLAIAETRGVGLLASSHLACVTVAPATIRKAVTGSGSAKKPEAIAAVCRIFGMASLPPDAADAAAAALAAGGFAVPPLTKARSSNAPTPRPARRKKAGSPAGTITDQMEV
jgi:crossover junction endodeoxyribonuclease RuvC